MSRKRSRGALLAALAGAALSGVAGCVVADNEISFFGDAFLLSSPSGEPAPAPACRSETFTQPAAESVTRKIDLLFVVDTSASLDDERAGIGDGLDALIAELPAEVDYQVAVMLAHSSRSSHSGRLYQKSSRGPVLRSATMPLASIQADLRYLMTNTSNDFYGDGGEEGLYSIHRAMDPGPLSSSRDKGFFRPDAALAVVFVADEQDICADYPEGIAAVPDPDGREAVAKAGDCGGITPTAVVQRLRSLQAGRPLLIASAVYSNRDTMPQAGENDIGYGYLETARIGGGMLVDLANPHAQEIYYRDAMGRIGRLANAVLSLETNFALAATDVDASSLQVYVDGMAVPFRYISETNVVHVDSQYAGTALSRVDVQYCPLPPPPAPVEEPAATETAVPTVDPICAAGQFAPKARLKVGISGDLTVSSLSTIHAAVDQVLAPFGEAATCYGDGQVVSDALLADGVSVLFLWSRVVQSGPANAAWVAGVRRYMASGGSVVANYDSAALMFRSFSNMSPGFYPEASFDPNLGIYLGLVMGGGLAFPWTDGTFYVTDPFDPLVQGVPPSYFDGAKAAFAVQNYDVGWLKPSGVIVASGGLGYLPPGTWPALLSGRCGSGRVALFTTNHLQRSNENGSPAQTLLRNSLLWAKGDR